MGVGEDFGFLMQVLHCMQVWHSHQEWHLNDKEFQWLELIDYQWEGQVAISYYWTKSRKNINCFICFHIKLPFPSSVTNSIDFGLRSSKKSYYFIVTKPNWEFVDVEEESKTARTEPWGTPWWKQKLKLKTLKTCT